MKLRKRMLALMAALLSAAPAGAATYTVAGENPGAADRNPGTEDAPWKTIARAGTAAELKPGDTVLIRSGVYREHVQITVSGAPGQPITFAAAPGHRVVIKGSELVRGPWVRLSTNDVPDEPFPFAFSRVWKTRLDERFFADPMFPSAYADRSRRWVSQVFLDDDHPLQMIGPDGVYKPDQFTRLRTIGRGLADMVPQSFWFDPASQTLYLDIGGKPTWHGIEAGVRGFALSASKVHDIVVRGLELRHNRQPGGQWPLVAVSDSARVTVEECKIHWADCCGLGVSGSTQCVVRGCDLSDNGCVGLVMSRTADCTVEACALLRNNYRRFCGDWGVAAAMKHIPGNQRTTIRGCECAYTIDGEGIWFDSDNADIRFLDNVCHDNDNCGIFFEINPGGGVIAGNLVFGNHSRGIYISGSQDTWVVHNTVAENLEGIVAMTRAKDEPPKNTRVLDNLLIRNYVTGESLTEGSDLTLEMTTDPAWRREMGSAADYNVYAANTWTPALRNNWNDHHTLPDWQRNYGQDLHSLQADVPYERFGTGFRLLGAQGLDVAGPLPPRVAAVWQPTHPRRVGANRTAWP